MARRGKVIPFPGVSHPEIPAQPAGKAPDEASFVEVYRCQPAEALVVKGLLESASIPTLLRSRIAHSVHPFTVGDQGEVVVLVPEAEAAHSRRLLARAVSRHSSGGGS